MHSRLQNPIKVYNLADKTNHNPEISVIIPALNEEKYIMNPLSGLKTQTYKNFETIVVDGGSKDDTVEISKKQHAKVATELRRGVAAGRNKGAKIAKGSLFVFLDADTKPSPGLLHAYAKAFDDQKVIAATGPIYPLEKTNLRIALGYQFVSVLFVKFTLWIGMPSIVGSNFAVRADTFRKVHGFDPELLTYEDWDLSNKLKKQGRIIYVEKATVKTSARRVVAWGVWGYFVYHVINMFMYNFLKRARRNYKTIR